MPLVNRFQQILQGALVLTGNTLQVRQGTAFPPGNDYTNGAFISTNTTLVAAAGFPNGTTFLASQASSTAVLEIPTGSEVVFAQLSWCFGGGTNTNASIIFETPLGTNTVAPNTALNQFSNPNNWRAQDVTALVKAAGAGVYTVGTSPGSNIINNSSIQGAGWWLYVVYKNTAMPYRFFSVNTGITPVSAGAPSDFNFTNIVTPTSGVVNGYLTVSEVFGDLIDAAQIFVGATQANSAKVGNPSTGTWDGTLPFAQINNMLPANILIADTNDPNIGALDTRGSFGTFNKNPFNTTAPAFARNIIDILGLDISDSLTNNQTSLFTRVTYSGTGSGSVTSQAIQVDVNSAVVSATKTVDKDLSQVGDTLTYTVVFKNTGLVSAESVFFVDTVPSGTTFVPGSFVLDGVTLPSADPKSPGVSLSPLNINQTYTVTFKVVVSSTVPTPNPLRNQSDILYTFVPGTGLTPVQTGAQSNIATTTIVSAVVTSTKSATPIVGLGDTISYTVVLTNSGNTSAEQVTLIDTIPSGTTFVPGSIRQDGAPVSGSPQPPGATLVNAIPGGGVSTVTFTVVVDTIPTPNTVTNTASATYSYVVDPTTPINGTGATSTTSVVTTINYARIAGDKRVNKAYANIGDTLAYTIVLTNTGVTTATNYVFIDTIPTGTSLVPNTFNQDNIPITGTPNPPGVTLPNSIGIGQTSTVSFVVLITTLPSTNPIPNTASGTFSYIGNPTIPTNKSDISNTNTVTTQVNNASLGGIVKSVDKRYADCGETLVYTIQIPNSGNVTATNVFFKDTIPSGTTFVPNSVKIDGATQSGVNPQTGVTIGTVAPGATVAVEFRVVVQC